MLKTNKRLVVAALFQILLLYSFHAKETELPRPDVNDSFKEFETYSLAYGDTDIVYFINGGTIRKKERSLGSANNRYDQIILCQSETDSPVPTVSCTLSDRYVVEREESGWGGDPCKSHSGRR